MLKVIYTFLVRVVMAIAIILFIALAAGENSNLPEWTRFLSIPGILLAGYLISLTISEQEKQEDSMN